MALAPGTRLGRYEIQGLAGVGGMGEVYRARDARLGRDVAVKVLPDHVRSDPSRIARFEREAKALAALSHPNIAVIYGVEETAAGADGTRAAAIAMEFVEGETLADRLAHGPVAEGEALEIAGQIADALEAAHEQGIIHRDVKPANVKITPRGVVKVLDFGLAKVVEDASSMGTTVTIDGDRLIIAGTPEYMAPEQAQGRPVDRRVDVWAFGVVLYEMLAGERPFKRDSVQDTLAAVLATAPDLTRVPPHLRRLLAGCLERDPRRRLRDVGDFRHLIDGPGEPAAPALVRRTVAVPALAALAVLATVLGAWGWLRPRDEAAAVPVHLKTALPEGVTVMRAPGASSSVAVSPDGRTLVIAGYDRGGQKLYLRPTDQLEATPLAGSDGGSNPFFSWDGAWIGFFADGWIKRVPVAGGAPVDVVRAPLVLAGASWGPDDRIVFSWGGAGQISIVDARGGESSPIAAVKSGFRPQFVDERRVLFDDGEAVYLLDLATGEQQRVEAGVAPRYAAGYLILSRGNTLLAAPFDPSSTTVGTLVPLVEGVARDASPGGGMRHYATSPGGTLAYIPAAAAFSLVVVGGDGNERTLMDDYQVLQNPQFSPGGERLVVAVARRAGELPELWVHELATGTATRLTFEGARAPVWSHDGREITYSQVGTDAGIYTRSADGRGDARRVVPLSAFHWLVGLTPDPRTLAYGVMEGSFSSIVAARDGGSRRVLGPSSIWGGRLSPDGSLLAYYSLDSGSFQVFVVPFPEGSPRWQIADGSDPTWSPDGLEVFYRSGPQLMAARVDTNGAVRTLSTRVVFEPFLPPAYDDYDVHNDGRTLAIVRPSGPMQEREVGTIVNFPALLTSLVRESD